MKVIDSTAHQSSQAPESQDDNAPLHHKGAKSKHDKKAQLSKFEHIQGNEPKKKGMLRHCNSKHSLYADPNGLPPAGTLYNYNGSSSKSKDTSQTTHAWSTSKDAKKTVPGVDVDYKHPSNSKTPRAALVESRFKPSADQIIT